MTEAFIYDAIRTPRGKGKADGTLHEVKPVNLLAGVLNELQRRQDLDTAQVDDVVMGLCRRWASRAPASPRRQRFARVGTFNAPACRSTVSAHRASKR